ncbi:MAG TPA: DUF6785 family protein [Armatimonadota bacterium]|nr:DUF6785 family protein [Armatimonadota bacterium]
MRIWKVILVGLPILIVANLWVRQGALITLAAQIAMAVPPVPALAALLLLMPAVRVMRRVGINRRDIIGVYCFLTLAVALTSGAAMRFFLPSLPIPAYFAGPENNYGQFQQYLPGWLVPGGTSQTGLLPRGELVIRDYFEGSEAGAVPWGAWLGPLGWWMLFFVAFYALLISIALVFRPVWEDNEHLAYPMAEFPLMLVGERPEGHGLWRNGAFWVGFGLLCLHHLMNILNAFNPAVTALGLQTDLGRIFVDYPYTALRPLIWRYRPAIFGIAWLMPSDIVVSTLIFYFIYIKGLSLGGAIFGVRTPRFTLDREQGAGAFVGFALITIYGARRRIAEVFRGLTASSEQSPALAIVLLASAATIFVFWRVAGMSTPIIVGYFGLLVLFALTYARTRAETGYPHHWIWPLDEQRNLLINFFGTGAMAPRGDFRGLTLLSMVHYLSRGYLPQLVAFPVDSLKIGGEIGVTARRMAVLMMLAVVLGSAVSWWMHLSAFYQYGANVLEGGTTSGGTRVALMRQSYDTLSGWLRAPEGPNQPQMIAGIAGFVIVLVLAALRRAFISFPLHPTGFVFSFTGAGENGWAALLTVSVIKSIVLRIGGMRLYKQLLPFFLGVVVGHFFAAGFVWALLASYGGQGFDKYPVWF